MIRSKEEQQVVRAICSTCIDMKLNVLVGRTCGTFLIKTKKPRPTCGCSLSVKEVLSDFHCPQKKW